MLFASSNIPEKRIRMMLSKKELSVLPIDSTDVYKSNMIDRHLILPKDAMFENLCYALFIKRHQLQAKSMIHDQKNWQINFDVLILSSGKILNYRKFEHVLRYNLWTKGLCTFTFYVLSIS